MASPKMMMSKDRRPLTTNFCLDHIPLSDDRLIMNQITGIKSQRERYIGLFRDISIYTIPQSSARSRKGEKTSTRVAEQKLFRQPMDLWMFWQLAERMWTLCPIRIYRQDLP